MQQDREYDFNVQVFTQSGFIDVLERCNSISVTNIGDTAVRIDQCILFPSATPLTALGDSVSFGGNQNEILARQQLQLIFVAPLGVLPQVQIIQKFFIK